MAPPRPRHSTQLTLLAIACPAQESLHKSQGRLANGVSAASTRESSLLATAVSFPALDAMRSPPRSAAGTPARRGPAASAPSQSRIQVGALVFLM